MYHRKIHFSVHVLGKICNWSSPDEETVHISVEHFHSLITKALAMFQKKKRKKDVIVDPDININVSTQTLI